MRNSPSWKPDVDSRESQMIETSPNKVAIVYDYFAHYRGPILNELDSEGAYEYLFVSDKKDQSGKVKEWDGLTNSNFVYAPCTRVGNRIMLQRGLLRLALRKDIHSIIYLGNAQWPMTWLSAAISHLTKKRVFFWTHGWIREEKGLKKFIRNSFYHLADGLLVYGHLAKNIGVSSGFEPDTIHVIYNSLDHAKQLAIREGFSPDEARLTRRELFGDSDLPVAIYTGRLTARKKVEQLILAAKVLKDEEHPVNVLIVGDGPEKQKLEALADRLQVPAVFYGACYDEHVLGRLIMSSTVSVSPGWTGLSVVHALGYGVPVISNDDPQDNAPEWEAILPGVNGACFQKDSIPSFAQAIRDWTSHRATTDAVSIKESCYQIVDQLYNPSYQRKAIERAIAGESADASGDVAAAMQSRILTS